MIAEIMSELKNLKEQNGEFRQETREGIKSIMDKLTKRNEERDEICSSLGMKLTNAENTTQEKFQSLSQQVKILEQKGEMRSKRKNKNYIIIKKGTNYTTDKTNMETRVKETIDKLATGISPVSMTHRPRQPEERPSQNHL